MTTVKEIPNDAISDENLESLFEEHDEIEEEMVY